MKENINTDINDIYIKEKKKDRLLNTSLQIYLENKRDNLECDMEVLMKESIDEAKQLLSYLKL